MRWEFYGLIVAVVVLLFAIFAKYRGGTEWFTARIKKRAITFGTPHRVELILIALYFVFFFIADLAQNKFLDNGINYQVIWFWNQTAPAILIWQIFLVLFQVVFIALFLLSIQSKSTSKWFDVVVGFVAILGLSLLWSGVIAQIYQGGAYFFGTYLRGIDYYHVGVYILMATGVYYVFTK